MKILNKEFDIDFYDADLMERIEEGMEKINNFIKENSSFKNQKSSVVIRKICKVIFNFLDDILGTGASKEIFGNKTSLTLCIKAYEDFVNAKKQQDENLENISKKYSPNRASRRAKK
jgi:hypothetical protein